MTGQVDTLVLERQSIPASVGRRSRVWIGGAALVVLLAGGAALFAPKWLTDTSQATAQPVAPPPPTVTVSPPLQRDLANWTTFTGQFSAVDYVELRAQVSGYLTEIHFTDGQIVHKGDLLFVIDPRPYEIVLQQANAQVLTAQAGLDLADKEIVRTAQLHRSDFASTELLDQRVQQQRAAQAALDQAKAAVASARLNLDFTHITAPLSGRISMHRVSIGNLIAGGQAGVTPTLLTTIVSLDPIHLDFDMSESDYLTYERFLQSQHGGASVDRTVEASLSDEQGWKHQGELDFMDNEMDRGSGTIHARASLPNPGLLIAPGEFARLRLPTSARQPTLLVPDSAISTDQSRTLVMTVAADGSVVPKQVELGPLTGGLREISSGLAPTDRVIINGLMRARPGSKVTPQPGTITPSAQS
ncbi:efflux RND transporter periplasmic adaptor subunit [Acidisphaera sp. S103]|uniref:efflux RND transporter periplasmic adaptor subunit n=1 Tax=Acidisphaera sp. S103 TaxID=1747223 RepID=UPI00131E3894|nr:efflux RND transporter periplasmic adaptor subunit [Acidisphaera sp. S103]